MTTFLLSVYSFPTSYDWSSILPPLLPSFIPTSPNPPHSPQLSLRLPETSPTPFKRLTGKKAQQVDCEPVTIRCGGDVRITLCISLPPGCHWTEGAPSAWQVIPRECSSVSPSILPRSPPSFLCLHPSFFPLTSSLPSSLPFPFPPSLAPPQNQVCTQCVILGEGG